MNFLWPLGLGFLGLLPAVVVLYFLRLRRTVKVVSSTWLWKRTLDEYRVNRPFQKFQNHLLLWLQLAALLLLAFAVARPAIEAHRTETGVHIVLVDQSASMGTIEAGGVTRLDLAKDFVKKLASGTKSTDRLAVIAFSDRASVVCPLTADRAAVLRGLDVIAPTHRPTRIEEGWQTALSIARGFDASDVYLVSDGGFRKLGALVEANANVHYVPVGVTADNLGVVHLETRLAEDDQRTVEIFARVTNRRTTDARATVELRLNDRLVDAQQVVLKAESDRGVVFERPVSDDGMAEVRIVGSDAFPEDNQAWIPLRSLETVRIVLVGEENVFLKNALANDTRVELTAVAAADYEKLKGQFAETDLTVFDGVTPAGPLERGTYLMFGAVPPDWKLEGATASPTLKTWSTEHALTRYINFSTLSVIKGIRFEPPVWAPVLLGSDQGPVMAAGERGGVRVAVAGFRLLDSDWPLRVSFPLFIANAIRWAKDADLASMGHAVLPGEPLAIRAPRELQEGTLTGPDGVGHRLSNRESDRLFYSRTDKPGVYRVRWDKAKADVLYAVSLLDAGESDIRPAEDIPMGEAKVSGRLASALIRWELTPWIALAGLMILVIEWFVYLFQK